MNKKVLFSAFQKSVAEISRIILGSTFVFSGFVKSVDVYGTAFKITDYLHAFNLDFLSCFSTLFAFALVGFEFLLGLWVCLGIWPRISSFLTLLTMLCMTLLTFYIALFDPVDDCGCFGDAFTLSNWATFYKNLVLLVAAVTLVSCYNRITPLFFGRMRYMAFAYLLLFISGFLGYNYMFEPLFDFRSYHVDANLREGSVPYAESADGNKVILIYEKEGVRQAFTPETSPWKDTAWAYVGTEISSSASPGMRWGVSDFSISKLIFSSSRRTITSRQDITNQVLLDPEYSFFMILPVLSNIDSKEYYQLAAIAKYANEKGYIVYSLTASPAKEVLEMQRLLPENTVICSMDNKTLRTVVRTNPGLLILKDGRIVAKWSKRSLPSEEFLTQSIEYLIADSPPPANVSRFILAVLILIVPLVALKVIGRIYKCREDYHHTCCPFS